MSAVALCHHHLTTRRCRSRALYQPQKSQIRAAADLGGVERSEPPEYPHHRASYAAPAGNATGAPSLLFSGHLATVCTF